VKVARSTMAACGEASGRASGPGGEWWEESYNTEGAEGSQRTQGKRFGRHEHEGIPAFEFLPRILVHAVCDVGNTGWFGCVHLTAHFAQDDVSSQVLRRKNGRDTWTQGSSEERGVAYPRHPEASGVKR
jgi:hypothetical protein